MIITIVGLPGSGKSAYGAYLSKKWQKKGIPSYTNYEVDGSHYFDTEDLGRYLMFDGNMVLDEAGIDISNRDFLDRKNKSTDKFARSFWKRHRHYGINEIYVLSQAFDFDKTVRNLSQKMYIIRKSIIPHLSILKPVTPYWDVDQDGQPCIKWKIAPLLFIPFYRKPYYKYYDSYSIDSLPEKQWPIFHDPTSTRGYIRRSRLDHFGALAERFIFALSQPSANLLP